MPAALKALLSALERPQVGAGQVQGHPNLITLLSVAQVEVTQCPRLEPDETQHAVAGLCSWLRAHEEFPDDTVLCRVFEILAQLLGKDQASDNIAVQKGLLSSAMTLLGNHQDVTLARYCLKVLATLSTVNDSDVILTRLGAVPLVTALLKKHPANVAVLEDAIVALAVMAKRTRHRRSISQSGDISLLIGVVNRSVDQPSLILAVCRFLQNYAVKEEGRLTVLQNGGVAALTAAFDSQTLRGPVGGTVVDMRAEIASAIWVCSTDCFDFQNALLVSGWPTSLAAVLQANPGHAGLHVPALGVARNLSRNSASRAVIVRLGFVPAALRAMRAFKDSIVLLKESCGLFGNLAADPEIRAHLGKAGVLEEVVSALANCQTQDDRKVAKLALGALANLSSCESNLVILQGTTVVPATLMAARAFIDNENILEHAISVISHLAVHVGCNGQLVEAGAVEALLLFLEEHCEDLLVVSRSLVALRRLLKHSTPTGQRASPLLQEISRAGGDNANGSRGIDLLVNAMERHIYDETVAKETALLLASLSMIPSNIPAILAAALQPCLRALELHQNEAPVADALAGLLALLPLEDDAEWSKVPLGSMNPAGSNATPKHAFTPQLATPSDVQ